MMKNQQNNNLRNKRMLPEAVLTLSLLLLLFMVWPVVLKAQPFDTITNRLLSYNDSYQRVAEYVPSQGGGDVPSFLEFDYGFNLKNGDWSYENHIMYFSVVPSADSGALISASFIVAYDAQKLSLAQVYEGNLFSGFWGNDTFFQYVECPVNGNQPPGCVASTSETGRVLVNTASLDGNVGLTLDNIGEALAEFGFRLTKPGKANITLENMDSRRAGN